MLLDGAYRLPERLTAPGPIFARWGLTLAADETRAVFDGLRKLGFDPGTGADLIRLDAVLNFQRAHGLTADGIIGRATLTTLQRAMDAKAKAVPVAGVITVAAIGAVNGATEALLTVPHSGPAVLAAGLIWGAAQVWTYRDALAGRIAASLPRLATYLRSR